jgi:hypothetical protein
MLPVLTLGDVVARLDDFDEDDTIYVEAPEPGARAVVAREAEDVDGLRYLLEVGLAKEAIAVWRSWRAGRTPTLDEEVAAVIYYPQNDAWMPVE